MLGFVPASSEPEHETLGGRSLEEGVIAPNSVLLLCHWGCDGAVSGEPLTGVNWLPQMENQTCFLKRARVPPSPSMQRSGLLAGTAPR